MRVVVLDFHGTLTLLPEPLAFVRSLREQGDYVVLWTGSPRSTVREVVPGLLEEVDSVVCKPDMPGTAIDRSGVEFDEVVVVDDQPALGNCAVRSGRVRPELWRFVPAENIRRLQRL